MYHELGHQKHYKNNIHQYVKGKEMLEKKEVIEAIKVSERATVSKEEFAAEVKAGLLSGESYDNKVIDVYLKYGGKI